MKSSSEVRESATLAERERIIKLLLETPEGLEAILEASEGIDEGKKLEALINGEQQ